MPAQLCIYEDDQSNRFLPLTWTRPVYDLKCGMFTLREKILRSYPGVRVCLACRDYLGAVMEDRYPEMEINTISGDSVLFVNGRVLAGVDFASKISLEGENTIYLSDDEVVAVRMVGNSLESISKKLGGVLRRDDFNVGREESVEAILVEYSWELISNNGGQIVLDYQRLGAKGGIAGKVYDGVHLLNPSMITVGKGSVVRSGAVLDAERGPIFIDEGVEILPNAVVEGPACIGRGSKIKIGAKIYGGTSVGEVCKVGGEVEESIIHGWSNKQHDGFLGHAYLGSWINLGADTNNSDLKNNYGSVKVFVDGEFVDSGQMFVGLMMGDHSKTGINTMFNTGSVVGVCCNVFGAGFPPKFVPSFSWVGGGEFSEYDLSKGVDTARRVMARRQVKMAAAYEKMLHEVYKKTVDYRDRFLKQE